MPVELTISSIPDMSTLIYFRNDDAATLADLVETWIDDNLAVRLPPLHPGESVAARIEEISRFRSSLRRLLLTDPQQTDPVTGVGKEAVVCEQLAVAWLSTVTPNRLN